VTSQLHTETATEIFSKHHDDRITLVITRNSFHQPSDKRVRCVSRIFSSVLLSCVLCASAPAAADVYQFIADDGTPHFSDQPSDSRFRLLLRTGSQTPSSGAAVSSRGGLRNFRNRFADEISAAAQANRLEPALLHAVIEIESGYNAKAISPKGALGLMQLMPATARRYAVLDPMDAVQNLKGGARLLRDLLDQFSGNKELALAAYNAGAGAVQAHGLRIPPYAETVRYVPAVLKSYELRKGLSRSD
jgi:soluble lytic murein transglycosylase-like protein